MMLNVFFFFCKFCLKYQNKIRVLHFQRNVKFGCGFLNSIVSREEIVRLRNISTGQSHCATLVWILRRTVGYILVPRANKTSRRRQHYYGTLPAIAHALLPYVFPAIYIYKGVRTHTLSVYMYIFAYIFAYAYTVRDTSANTWVWIRSTPLQYRQ